MALVLDTGPLYASLDQRDAADAACRRLIERTDEPLVIPDYWIHARLHPDWLRWLPGQDSNLEPSG